MEAKTEGAVYLNTLNPELFQAYGFISRVREFCASLFLALHTLIV